MTPLEHLAVGDALPPLELAPVTRAQLALFAGASGDHNPIHIDTDFARAAGHPDVFAHGMLVMAELGRLLTAAFPIGALRSFSARFAAITRVHDQLTCRGTVASLASVEGERRATLDLTVVDRAGEIKLAGVAIVALPAASKGGEPMTGGAGDGGPIPSPIAGGRETDDFATSPPAATGAPR